MIEKASSPNEARSSVLDFLSENKRKELLQSKEAASVVSIDHLPSGSQRKSVVSIDHKEPLNEIQPFQKTSNGPEMSVTSS